MKASAKTLLIAVGMAAALAAAIPVQAQPSTAFGLQFGFGAPEPGASERAAPERQGSDTPNGDRPGLDRPDRDRNAPNLLDEAFGLFNQPERLALCFTPGQIRDAIAGRGYTDIALNVADDPLIEVRASLDGTVYLLEYNFCTDEIEAETVLR